MNNDWAKDFSIKFRNGDFPGLVSLIKSVMHVDNGFLYLSSPFSNNKCVAICSSNKQGAQLILFKGLQTDEAWVLVQGMNFADVIVNRDDSLILTDDFFSDQVDIARNYLLEKKNANLREANKFSGFLLNNNRPYHYFYDSLKSLLALKDEGFYYTVATNDPFYDVRKLGFITSDIDADKIYIKPSVIGQNYSTVNKEASSIQMKHMEEVLFNNIKEHDFFNKDSYSKIFWIGITGQKRSWVEQIVGYSNIIVQLVRYFPGSLFVIDGMTSSLKHRLESIEEDMIINKIKNNVVELDCDVLSMRSLNYEEKISIAKDCDYYIANSGTGCMVPQRICSLPGVTHSNGSMFAFMDHKPPSFTLTISKDNIIPIGDSEQPKMFQSYSIPWQAVYNSLIKVIMKFENIHIEPLDIPSDYIPLPDDVSLSNHLTLRAKKHGVSKAQLIEILKEVSLVLEKNDNRASAFDVMRYALLLRPNGKYIINKIKSLL